jgi:hypothetical protein
MNYMEIRGEDRVLGWGMVEGGAKRYRARLCGAGMRWSRKGAENLTPVRTAILGGRFADRRRAAQNLAPACAQHGQFDVCEPSIGGIIVYGLCRRSDS